jgi:WD40 repeat protein
MMSRWSLVVFAGCCLAANVSGETPVTPRTDALGDPLPPGAVARLGTLRLKHAPDSGVPISAAVFSQDGKRFASLDTTGTNIRVWDVITGKEIPGSWRRANAHAAAAAISPDGATLAIVTPRLPGHPQIDLLLYDIGSTRDARGLGTLRFQARALRFADSGKTLVAAGEGTVCWWDVATAKEIRTWKPFGDDKQPAEDGSVRSKVFDACALSPDARSVAVHVATLMPGGLRPPQRFGENPLVDHEAIGFDLTTQAMTWRTVGKYNIRETSHFAFSADSKRVAIALGPDAIEVRNAKNGKLVSMPVGRQVTGANYISSLALSPDGKTAGVAGTGQDVVFWTVDGEAVPRKLTARSGSNSASCAEFSPDNRTLVVGVRSDLRLYDVATLRETHAWAGHRSGIDFLTFNRDGSRLVSGSAVENLQPRETATWNTDSWKPVQQNITSGPRKNVGNVSPDQAFYVGMNGDDRFALYDFKSGRLLARFHVPPRRKAPAPDQENVYYYRPQRQPGSGFFSPSSKLYLLTRQDDQGKNAEGVYAVPSGKLLCLLPSLAAMASFGLNGEASRPIAFSADERLVALFGQQDGKIYICDLKTGKGRPPLGAGWMSPGDDAQAQYQRSLQMQFFAGHLAFSQDGKALASWSTLENIIQVWDVGTGKELLRISLGEPKDSIFVGGGFRINRNRVTFAWRPDNRLLAVADNKIQLWELATGKVRQEWPGHDGAAVRTLAYAPSGRFLASGSSDTTALIWDMALVEQTDMLPAEPVAQGWQGLAEDDAIKAFAAIRALTAKSDESVAWIKEHLKAARPIEARHIDDLIGQLDESGFRPRQKATAELVQIGERALEAIDKALAGSPTLETRRRLEEVRKRVSSRLQNGQNLQACRAVEVLEHIGNPAAREVLAALAAGAPGALLTTQAQDALGRLQR